MKQWFGINYPFKGGAQNILTRQVGIRIIKNDLLQLIFTNPGERVYRPDYGVGIRRFLFESFDSQFINDLKSRIIDQINRHESRVEINTLNIEEDKDNNLIKVLLICSLIQQPDEKFQINLDLPILSEVS